MLKDIIMHRDCLEQIVQWKDKRNRKPLVLMGARQVGKTWLMEEFARREFPKDHVLVNFMRKRSLCEQLKNGDIDPASLVRLLQTATGKLIIPGKTLLILDEIQECPSALTALKFFQEDMPQLAVMAAGSLLGLSFGANKDEDGQTKPEERRESFPVGKIDRLNVYPLTLSEFMRANGKEAMVNAIETGDWKSVEALSGEYEMLLKNYMVVGGMPEPVNCWVETSSLAEARRIQRRMLLDYDDDFKKHAPIDLLPKIRLLWNNIPSQLAKENGKFIYSALKSGARAREYEVAVEWLRDAGMVYKLYRACPPRLPLPHYADLGAFKLFMHDVGLLGAMSHLEPSVVLDGNSLFTNFKGSLTEQFAMQELVADGIVSYYWTPDAGISEVDFVVQGSRAVYPVEVKSATNTKAKSLKVYMDAYNPPFAVKSSLKNYSGAGSVRSVPLYALGLLLGRMIG